MNDKKNKEKQEKDYINLINGNEISQKVGFKIKQLRETRGLDQETLAMGICDRNKLVRYENGKAILTDLGTLSLLLNKLEIPLGMFFKMINKERNDDFEITLKIYDYIINYAINNKYLNSEEAQKVISKNSKLRLCIINAKLFYNFKFNEIIVNLEKKINKIIGLPDIIELLLINYYLLSHIEIYDINSIKMKQLNKLVEEYTIAIKNLKDYHPNITTILYVNLAEYYWKTNEMDKCFTILKEVEIFCIQNKYYDLQINILFIQSQIAQESNDIAAFKQKTRKIKAYFNILVKDEKYSYLKNRYKLLIKNHKNLFKESVKL